ncbi:NrfD/PsrC family molybdoenzyme membrane anchor subunit [Adlercreutzia sp. R21]|uniref:NrfD/PsrC family molybdoenzyme membrane anchor subunit n=1 Tax=Adlercreutzia wanghongyangiae TaxID=3111451 RepID=UPI002DBD1615|nr:NrfD/PsrC family molybdoenzyme membrane anchor subunit [Adlercreutzia sp. R21]MEC4183911.1 NrfD/PsrC family molybdoenzyme membrane anchor subunit [Adlercreutzia sp. R21]
MFGIAVVCYLFLGGVGGGLCAVLAALTLAAPAPSLARSVPSALRGFFARGWALAALLLFVGALCLLADSGNYPALPQLFFSGRLTYLTVGTYALTIAVGCCLAAMVFWRCVGRVGSLAVYRAAHGLLLVIGVVVALYTGLFLADIPAVAFWHTPWLPPLFLCSSLSCGLALAPLVAWAGGAWPALARALRPLVAVDAFAIGLEMLCLALVVALPLLGAGADSFAVAQRAAALDVVTGAGAPLFWVAVVGAGLVVPLGLEAAVLPVAPSRRNCPSRRPRASSIPFFAVVAVLVVAGALLMRYCIVNAGTHPAVYLMGV